MSKVQVDTINFSTFFAGSNCQWALGITQIQQAQVQNGWGKNAR